MNREKRLDRVGGMGVVLGVVLGAILLSMAMGVFSHSCICC